MTQPITRGVQGGTPAPQGKTHTLRDVPVHERPARVLAIAARTGYLEIPVRELAPLVMQELACSLTAARSEISRAAAANVFQMRGRRVVSLKGSATA